MRSKQLMLEQYDSDKISNQYLDKYDPIFAPYVDKKIALLELGVRTGGSLRLWKDYFPHGTIVGVDIELPKRFEAPERVHVFEGSQADPQFLSDVATKTAPGGFDIIIDDASHIGELSKISFWHLFENHLKPHGLYVIEDWGTGYWNDWHDGKSLELSTYLQSNTQHVPFWMKNRFLLRVMKRLRPKIPMRCHSYGMVGFVKQLMDEQGASDVTRRSLKGSPQRGSRFKSMIITSSIVFINKAGNISENR